MTGWSQEVEGGQEADVDTSERNPKTYFHTLITSISYTTPFNPLNDCKQCKGLVAHCSMGAGDRSFKPAAIHHIPLAQYLLSDSVVSFCSLASDAYVII